MFKDNLISLRRANGLSQDELAEKIGVTRQTLSKYETGESLPDIERCKQLADIFGVSMDDLVNYEKTDRENMGLEVPPKGKHIFGMVKVGDKGQIVIPANGQITVNGVLDGKMCRLKLGDIYYFEVVEGNSFLYCQKEVFSCKQKLYEFEALCIGTMLFRCSKSMILNAGKIDSILPSLSGRFEAVLDNGEKVMISRQYVSALKRLLGR